MKTIHAIHRSIFTWLATCSVAIVAPGHVAMSLADDAPANKPPVAEHPTTPGVPNAPAAPPETPTAPVPTAPAPNPPAVNPPAATPPATPPTAAPPAANASPSFPGAEIFNSHPPFLVGVTVNNASAVYAEGEKLSAEFKAERDAHLYLLYHQADGQTVLLFPNESHPDNRVPSNQPTIIPAKGEKFRFRIRAPFGAEVFQVIASLEPLAEFDALVQQKSGRAPVVSRELLESLAARLLKNTSTWTEYRQPIKTVAKAADMPARKAARVGLFVGVGKFADPQMPVRPEWRNSAEAFHQAMLQRGGLDPDRTRIVLDEQATRANLEEHIARWLPSVTEPGDTVFIYFAGNAVQAATSDLAEPDGRDEALVPYDGRYSNQALADRKQAKELQASLIFDDALARWLEALQGRQVVLIVDTAHSAGLIEGKGLPTSVLVDEVRRMKGIVQLDTIVLASCGPAEFSVQASAQGNESTPLQLFTHSLIVVINNQGVPRPLFIKPAFDAAKQEMKELFRKAGVGLIHDPVMTDNGVLPVTLAP